MRVLVVDQDQDHGHRSTVNGSKQGMPALARVWARNRPFLAVLAAAAASDRLSIDEGHFQAQIGFTTAQAERREGTAPGVDGGGGEHRGRGG